MSEQLTGQEGPVVFVDVSGMRQPGTHGGLSEYLIRLWDARTLAFHEARSSVLGSQARNKLGTLWLILTPLFNGLIYYVVFGFVFQTSKGIENFIGFLLIGLFMFHLTTGAINSSSDAIFAGRKLITANNLPVAAIPLIRNIQMWLSGIPSYLVMVLVIIVAPPTESFSVLSFLFLPLLLLQAGLSAGMSLIVAAVVARVHDLKNLTPVFTRAWLYASGVMFSVDRLTDAHAAFGPFVEWNPMHHVLTIARDVLLYATVPDARSWLIVGVWTMGTLLLGLLLVWKGEGKYDLGSD